MAHTYTIVCNLLYSEYGRQGSILMETKVSEESNKVLIKSAPQELVFPRVLYLDSGGSNRYFRQRLYLYPPNITLVM